MSEDREKGLHCAYSTVQFLTLGEFSDFDVEAVYKIGIAFCRFTWCTNVLGSESVNCETDDKCTGIFELISRCILELHNP